MDNFAEYDDPLLYDLENPDFEPDGPFYLALARKHGDSVLEIGCGTGRIAIPMAREGIRVTGIDLMLGMLERARHKAGDLPVRWIEADARDFHVGEQYGLIFEAGSVFHHQLTRHDQESMLACVRQHLTSDGRFVVNAIFPKPYLLADEPAEQDWFTYQDDRGQEIRVSGTDHYDPITQIKTETAVRRWKDSGGNEIVRRASLMLRYFFPEEMEALLHYNGFRVVERYGDTDFSPLTDDSPHLIFVCETRK